MKKFQMNNYQKKIQEKTYKFSHHKVNYKKQFKNLFLKLIALEDHYQNLMIRIINQINQAKLYKEFQNLKVN